MSVPSEPEFEEEPQKSIEKPEDGEVPLSDTLENGAELLSENELPPEAQGETNGGPLGCCLGVTVGIMISLFVGVIGLGPLVANAFTVVIHTSAIDSTRVATALFALVGAVIFGYIGWRVGKRMYREYELSPRQQRKLARLQQRELSRLQRKS